MLVCIIDVYNEVDFLFTLTVIKLLLNLNLIA